MLPGQHRDSHPRSPSTGKMIPVSDTPSEDQDPDGALARQRRLFESTFGVSEDELVRHGIDPTKYARDHISEELRDDDKAKNLLPESQRLMLRSLRFGRSFYSCLFLGLALLFVLAAKPQPWLRVVVLVLASFAVVAAFACLVAQIRLYRQYVQACHIEGRSPLTMWGRRTPAWRHRQQPR